MSYRAAIRLLLLQALLLIIGTQMPGTWRDGIVENLHLPSMVSPLAHFVLFAGLSAQTNAQPLAWPWWRVLLAMLGLALLTEALQFIAIDRHPRFLDVSIDLGGTLTGLLLTLLFTRLKRGRVTTK